MSQVGVLEAENVNLMTQKGSIHRAIKLFHENYPFVWGAFLSVQLE